MAGLTHPRDLAAWHRWQLGRQPWTRRLRGVTDVLIEIARPSGRAGGIVVTRGGSGPVRLLVCLDSRSPTSVQALLRPLEHLPLDDVAVVSTAPVEDLLPPWVWRATPGLVHEDLPGLARDARVVLSTGHFQRLGRAARDATGDPARFVTVQHGLLTPHAPPLAEGTTLLAWSEADAGYWRSGREDGTATVVGSQLLWEAAAHPVAPDPDAAPVFLGQLHGAELDRADAERAAAEFCRRYGATYRPHPAETDRRSRATHARWEAEGLRVDRSGVPLRTLRAPVASVFSTGVLEAAAAGLPAGVFLPDPPAWLLEFWDRYGLRPWEDRPTPSPERPPLEPSRAVARAVEGMMAG